MNYGLSIAQAFALRAGDTLYALYHANADGTPQRWVVTSVRTWKTRPEEIRIRVKRGLREFFEFDEYQLGDFTIHEIEAEAELENIRAVKEGLQT